METVSAVTKVGGAQISKLVANQYLRVIAQQLSGACSQQNIEAYSSGVSTAKWWEGLKY